MVASGLHQHQATLVQSAVLMQVRNGRSKSADNLDACGEVLLDWRLNSSCSMAFSSTVARPVSTQANPAFRVPRRITITVPYRAYQRLLERSEQEGRSLSNLAAFLLENAMDAL